jgi:DnaK suppressor protein
VAKSKPRKPVAKKSLKKSAKPAAKKVVVKKSTKTAARPAPKVMAAPKVAMAPKMMRGKMNARDSAREMEPRRDVPIEPPMTTDSKPRKNQAGLGSKELEHFRQLLLAKRRELVGDMSSMEREALRSTSGSNLSNLPIHMADMGTDNYEQEFTLGLVEKDRVLLREINVALAKIQDGTYGICEGTGKPIGKARLEAKPWARHSIEYARKMENGMVR